MLEGVSLLFFTREDVIHKRITTIYKQLEEANKLASILTLCDTISSIETRNAFKLKIIEKLLGKWFGLD